MTREYRETVKCEHCGRYTRTLDPFNRWVHDHPRLHSVRDSITVNNPDVIIHRYRIGEDNLGTRLIQAVMWIEVKRHGARPELSQKDDLHIVNQMLSNERATPTKAGPRWSRPRHAPVQIYSALLKRKTFLWAYGVHSLYLSGSTPDDSNVILWDKREITVEQLVRILRFELHPTTLAPNDEIRRHHKRKQLPLFEGITV